MLSCRTPCFASIPTASFISHSARTTPPAKYTSSQPAPNVYTLVTTDNQSNPSHIHILPVIHALQSTHSQLLNTLTSLSPPPKALVLELCSARMHLLQQTQQQQQKQQPPSTNKPLSPFSVHTLLQRLMQAQSQTLQTAVSAPRSPAHPANQMQIAYNIWVNHLSNPPQSVILADRRIDTTLRHWANTVSICEKLKLIIDSLLTPLIKITPSRLQRAFTSAQTIAQWRSQLARTAPATFCALCQHRELHMVWALRDSVSVLDADCVVLICGAVHAPAICQLLETAHPVDIHRICSH